MQKIVKNRKNVERIYEEEYRKTVHMIAKKFLHATT